MKHKRWQIVVVLAVLALTALACSFSASTAKIESAIMARDSEGADPTTVFAPSDVMYAVVDLRNAPDDTTVKAVWSVVNVEGVEPNFLIDEVEITSGSSMLNFELANSDLWPSGTYKVDLYLNGELNQTLEFSVE